MSQAPRPNLWQIPAITAYQTEQTQPLVIDLKENLIAISQRFKAITLANSLAVEDLVITDLASKLELPIDVFILDTKKLHNETNIYINTIKNLYKNLNFHILTPLEKELSNFSQQYTPADIYQSLNARQACCYARKVEPLNRALENYQAWITGQRRAQSTTRSQLALEEFDAIHQRYKFNPLALWSQEHVWAYVQQHQLPINPLYSQGLPSIGCEPCTRPIRQHEPIRAGRWWWESQTNKECGLHNTASTALS